MAPIFSRAEGLLALCYTEQGRFDDALFLADHVQRTSDPGWGLGHRARILFRAGQHALALRTLAKAEKVMRGQHRDPSAMLATMYASMGEKDEAFAWLQKTHQGHSSLIVSLKVDPVFDPVRGDSRFQQLLRDVGLAVPN